MNSYCIKNDCAANLRKKSVSQRIVLLKIFALRMTFCDLSTASDLVVICGYGAGVGGG